MHMTYADAFRKAVANNWGREVNESAEGEKAVIADPALVMLGFFGALSQALGASVYHKPAKKIQQAESTDGVYPDCGVGDLLWAGDISDGFSQYVIIKMDSEKHAYVVSADSDYDPYGYWAAQNMYKEIADAILESAKSDVDYHAPRLNWAKQAIAAVEGAAALQPFINGFTDD